MDLSMIKIIIMWNSEENDISDIQSNQPNGNIQGGDQSVCFQADLEKKNKIKKAIIQYIIITLL